MDAAARLDDRARAASRYGARLAVAAVALLAVLLLTGLEPLRVASVSMSPTLVAGDQVLVDKVSIRLRPPTQGDLVVFRDPQHHDLVVKRVVALGGQTVAIEDAVLVVDGTIRQEPQVDLSRIDSTYFGPITVPRDAVFVLGDNRSESIDSRTYGAIPLDQLVGRVVLSF